RDHAFAGAQRVVRRPDAGRSSAGLDGLDRAHQQAAGLDDGLVGGAEVLLRAVDDAAHALLGGAVLDVAAVDAAERFGLLGLPVEQVVVRAVLPRAERGLVDVVGAVAGADLETLLVGHRRVGEAVHPVVDHRVLVVHRDPDVPGHHRLPGVGLRRPDL